MTDERMDGDFVIADDEQIADMQREYQNMGIGVGKNESRLRAYPLPIYMVDKCFEFCKSAKEMKVLVSQLDKAYALRNGKALDFITSAIEKNRICIAKKGDVMQDILIPAQRMPIKQSMYRLLELSNIMSIILDSLSEYVKSVDMQDCVMRHMLMCSVLHGLCI